MYLNEVRDRLFNFMFLMAQSRMFRYRKPFVPDLQGGQPYLETRSQIKENTSDNHFIIIIDTCIILISR